VIKIGEKRRSLIYPTRCVSGITFFRYALTQNIGNPNKLATFSWYVA